MNTTTASFSIEEMKKKAVDKAKQLSALQQQLAAKLANQPFANASEATAFQQCPSPIVSTKPTPTVVSSFGNQMETPQTNPYLASFGLSSFPSTHRRELRFHEKGKFEKIAFRMRAQEQLERLQQQIAESARRVGMDSIAEFVPPPKETVPDIEWWDSLLLRHPTYQSFEDQGMLALKDDSITHFIQHPAQITMQNGYRPSIVQPLLLTKEERKKLRRQRRLAAEREKQEKIRMGLIPPPEPKVKLSNFMRVLATHAIQDPTKVEADVRRQMAKRQEEHMRANEKRKLTPEQRREKRRRKLTADALKGIQVAVFRVQDLSHQQRRYKVDIGAQQNLLSGCAIIGLDWSLIIVEGGAKSIHRFKQLMLKRIKWNDHVPLKNQDETGGKDSRHELMLSSDEENDQGFMNDDELLHHIEQNRYGKHTSLDAGGSDRKVDDSKGKDCSLVWEGHVPTRSFEDFRIKTFPNEHEAKEYLRAAGVEQYWYSAKNI